MTIRDLTIALPQPRKTVPNLTTKLQQGIARLHRQRWRKGLPARIAIYMHELEASQWRAFREAIVELRRLGYRDVDPQAYVDAAVAHSSDRLLFVSFDDNYRGWHTARRLFDETGIRATFYVSTLPFRDRATPAEISGYFDRIQFSGERIPLTTSELRELARDGHTIGCHSHSHFNLARLPESEYATEIGKSKSSLEDLLGQPIVHFAYPFGMRRFLGPRIQDHCREIGFRTIAAAIPAMLHVGVEDASLIHRSGWRLDDTVENNIADLEIDGRVFERLTGRSAIGAGLG